MEYEIVRNVPSHFNHDSYSIYSRVTVIPLNPQINRPLLKPRFFGGVSYDGVFRLWQVGNWIGTFPVEICGQQGPSIPYDQSMWILGYIYDTHIVKASTGLVVSNHSNHMNIWEESSSDRFTQSFTKDFFLSPLVTTGFVEFALH